VDGQLGPDGQTLAQKDCRASLGKRTAKYLETVRYYLSCVLRKTHGKDGVCCAPDEKRTTNILTHGILSFSRSDVFRRKTTVDWLLIYSELADDP
jgi:hypothetical protein